MFAAHPLQYLVKLLGEDAKSEILFNAASGILSHLSHLVLRTIQDLGNLLTPEIGPRFHEVSSDTILNRFEGSSRVAGEGNAPHIHGFYRDDAKVLVLWGVEQDLGVLKQ